jgi:hypothetical protein
MQIDIHWEDAARRIIRVNCSGAWLWSDMAKAIQNWRATQPPSSPFEQNCIIVDLRGITAMPTDAVLHLKDAATSSGNVNGKIVVIISSSAIAVLFKMFVTLYWKVGGKFQAASSVEEAYKLLGILSE